MDSSDIPPYHKVTYQCGECGLEKEDSQIFRYVNQGSDFFIENLEPELNFWQCSAHPGRAMYIRTQEIKSQEPHLVSAKYIEQMNQR